MKTKMKLILWWINFKHKRCIIWCAAALLIGCVGTLLLTQETSTAAYYYIDLNGNQGVAKKCWENESGLICDRAYGGKITVREYWKSE